MGKDSIRGHLFWNQSLLESRAGSVTDVLVTCVWKEPPWLATWTCSSHTDFHQVLAVSPLPVVSSAKKAQLPVLTESYC